MPQMCEMMGRYRAQGRTFNSENEFAHCHALAGQTTAPNWRHTQYRGRPNTAVMTRDFANPAFYRLRLLWAGEATGRESHFLQLQCRKITVGFPPCTKVTVTPLRSALSCRSASRSVRSEVVAQARCSMRPQSVQSALSCKARHVYDDRQVGRFADCDLAKLRSQANSSLIMAHSEAIFRLTPTSA